MGPGVPKKQKQYPGPTISQDITISHPQRTSHIQNVNSSHTSMMNLKNLDDYITSIENAVNEIYTIGRDSADISRNLYELAKKYGPSLSNQQLKELRNRAVADIKNALDAIIRREIDGFKKAIVGEYDKKLRIYQAALSIVDTYTQKYEISKKEELLELAKRNNEPPEILSAIEMAIRFGKDLQGVKDYLSSRISAIKQERDRALIEIDNVYLELRNDFEALVEKYGDRLIEVYNKNVNLIREQVQSDIGGSAERLGGYAKNAINQLHKITEELSAKEKEFDEKATEYRRMSELYLQQENIGSALKYRRREEEVLKYKSKISSLRSYVSRATDNIRSRLPS